MRLFEAIIDANHRAVAGDASAGLHPAEFADHLPIIALTCIDPRLNALFPNVLGIPGDQFIWMRNAGNIVTGPLSSTMRSLALACAVKGGQEIAIIGHTDCQICKTTTMQLLDLLKTAGVERAGLPENLNEFFGMFATERQNVIKACDIVRHSPLIGPKIPVHGLLVDIETGKLEWLVNGYEVWQRPAAAVKNVFSTLAGASTEELGAGAPTGFNFGEMKFPESKIGEIAARAGDWLAKKVEQIETKPGASPAPATPVVPPKIPLPPPIRPRINVRRTGN
jgi:carbonic anhydrase